MNTNVNVPVLLIFFNRPKMIEQVFAKVREAKPIKLFLYQDGPRDNREDDVKNVMACRKVVENIDWDCDVHYLYQEKNYGCDPSEYLAIRWFFNHVEKGIILEDDDVPSISFFEYCRELLDKYEDDERIATISGMNHLERWNTDESTDYFFAHGSSIWGWATWRRFVDQWDTQYSFLDDPEKIRVMKKNFHESHIMKSDRVTFDLYLKKCKEHKMQRKEFYETLVSSTRLLNNQLGIFPSVNMISNIGFVGESTHGTPELKKLPKVAQKVFNIKRYEMKTPLRHPTNVEASDKYLFKKESLMTPSIFNYPFRWLECKIRNIIYR